MLSELCRREAESVLGRGADAQDAAREALVRALGRRRPARDRELLHARYWEGSSGADASLRLGHTEAAVRIRLHRVRRALQPSLGHALGRVG